MTAFSFVAGIVEALAANNTRQQIHYNGKQKDAGIAGEGQVMSGTAQSYVIEVGEDQVGIIIREAGERDFQFHAALIAYQALEGRRFANPFLAEQAAIAHSVGRRAVRRSGSTLFVRVA